MRTRPVMTALLAGLLVALARPAAAVVYVTINIPVDVDKLDPSIATVSCACFLKGPGHSGSESPTSPGGEGPTLSSMGSSTSGTVTGGSFHGTLTSTLGDSNAPMDTFLRAEEVTCFLNLRTSGGIDFQPGSKSMPSKSGPTAPAPGTTYRPKISIPLRGDSHPR